MQEERLQHFTTRLHARVDDPRLDAEDARLLQVLLEEYARALREVRAAAQMVDTSLNRVASTMRAGRRIVRRARSDAPAADAD